MTFGKKILYAFVISWFRLLSFLPIRFVFLLSELITFIVYYIIGYRRKIVIDNLRNSFPDKSNTELQLISRKYYRHLSVMIVENVYLRFVSDKKFVKRFSFENIELLDEYYERKQNIIIMTGHYSNWEYGASISRYCPYKSAAVYKRLTSPVFDKIYYDIRKRLGSEPVEMADTFRKTIALNKRSEPWALMMVADQSPIQGDSQYWLKFLNQQTGVFQGSEKLAKRFNMPVFYLELTRTRKGAYKAKLSLICDKPQECPENKITEDYFSLLEQTIIRYPRMWLWSHRRWKNKPPENNAE